MKRVFNKYKACTENRRIENKRIMPLVVLLCLMPVVCSEDMPNYFLNANISIILQNELYTYTIYTKLFKITNLNNESANITLNYEITGNEIKLENFSYYDNFAVEVNKYRIADTGEIYLSKPGNYTLCGWFNDSCFNNSKSCKNITLIDLADVGCDIKIEQESERYFKNNETVEIRHIVNNTEMPFMIEYWIEDIYGNIAKEKQNTTNTNTKTWKIKSERELDVLSLKAVLYSSCNDTNIENNNITKEIIVLSNNTKMPFLNIIEIYNEDKINFGDTIKARIASVKNSTKSVLEIYVADVDEKRVSEITKIGVYKNMKEEDFSVYIKLIEGCSMKDGIYSIIAEGLDMKAGYPVKIYENNKCKENNKETKEEKRDVKKKEIKSDEKKTSSKKTNKNEGNKSNTTAKTINKTTETTAKIKGNEEKRAEECTYQENNRTTNAVVYKADNSKNMMPIFLIALLVLNAIVIFLNKT